MEVIQSGWILLSNLHSAAAELLLVSRFNHRKHHKRNVIVLKYEMHDAVTGTELAEWGVAHHWPCVGGGV